MTSMVSLYMALANSDSLTDLWGILNLFNRFLVIPPMVPSGDTNMYAASVGYGCMNATNEKLLISL